MQHGRVNYEERLIKKKVGLSFYSHKQMVDIHVHYDIESCY